MKISENNNEVQVLRQDEGTSKDLNDIIERDIDNEKSFNCIIENVSIAIKRDFQLRIFVEFIITELRRKAFEIKVNLYDENNKIFDMESKSFLSHSLILGYDTAEFLFAGVGIREKTKKIKIYITNLH